MFGIRFSRPCHGDLGLIICVLALALTLEVASASKSQGSLKAERPRRGQDEGRLFLRSSFARMRRSAEYHGHEQWHTGATELENAIFAARGQTVFVPCVPKQSGELVDAEYLWADRHGNPLVDSRFSVKETGDLEVTDIQPEDSGMYQCHAAHHFEGTIQEEKHIHHLLEYTLPSFHTDAIFVYDMTDACETTFAKAKEQEFRTELCAAVTEGCVYGVNSTCHVRREEVDPEVFEARHELWITVAIRHNPTFAPPACDPNCMKEAVLANIDNNAIAVVSLADKEIRESESSFARFNPSKFVKQVVHKCTPGYRPYGSIVCLPCEPGSYSNHPTAESCTHCAHGYYQDKYAMTDCFHCPHNGTTSAVGAHSIESCHEAGSMSVSLSQKGVKKLEAGVVVGGVVGALVMVAGLVVGVLLYQKRTKKAAVTSSAENPEDDPEVKEFNDIIRNARRMSQNERRHSHQENEPILAAEEAPAYQAVGGSRSSSRPESRASRQGGFQPIRGKSSATSGSCVSVTSRSDTNSSSSNSYMEMSGIVGKTVATPTPNVASPCPSYETPDVPPAREYSSGINTLIGVLKSRRDRIAPDTDDEEQLRGKSAVSVNRRVSSSYGTH